MVNIQIKAILVVCPVVLFRWSKPKPRGITIKWEDSVNFISSSFKRSLRPRRNLTLVTEFVRLPNLVTEYPLTFVINN